MTATVLQFGQVRARSASPRQSATVPTDAQARVGGAKILALPTNFRADTRQPPDEPLDEELWALLPFAAAVQRWDWD
jgi:hypothetical protein